MSRITESNLVKRLEDIIQKWSFDELDQLSEMEFPDDIEISAGKSVEDYCPFDGNTMLAKQLVRLWKLLSKLQIVEPIFQQFLLDRISGLEIKNLERKRKIWKENFTYKILVRKFRAC